MKYYPVIYATLDDMDLIVNKGAAAARDEYGYLVAVRVQPVASHPQSTTIATLPLPSAA